MWKYKWYYFKRKLYSLILYFIKNWFGADIINYGDLPDNFLKFRTNNTVEGFHSLLNNTIKNYRPKISYFLEKYKLFIKDNYDKYINSLKNISIEK